MLSMVFDLEIGLLKPIIDILNRKQHYLMNITPFTTIG